MKSFWLYAACIILLSGCLDAEKLSLSLDLKSKTAEVGYSNIVSDSKEESKIKEDFEELIEKAYGDKKDHDGRPGQPISAKLYEEDGHLDGVAVYSFKDSAQMIKEYEIETDNKGDFILDLGKESNRDLEYAGGNGAYIEEGTKRLIRWSGNSTSLKVKLRNKLFDSKSKSLLSYWVEWKTPK